MYINYNTKFVTKNQNNMRFVHVWLNIFHEYWNKNQISWLSRQINIHIDNNILWMNEEKSTNVWYKYIYFINLVFSLLQEPPILQISEKELTFCIITNWTKFSLIRFFISLFWFLLILLELKPPYEPLCPSIGRSVGGRWWKMRRLSTAASFQC